MAESHAITRDRLEALLVGEDRATTRRALVLAAGYVLALVILDYANLRTGLEISLLNKFVFVFSVKANPVEAVQLGYFGAFFVTGLAGLHAYLNEGYLPSVALGVAPIYGSRLWTIGSMEEIANLYLDPFAAVRRAFPEAFAFATVGFLLGLGLRRLKVRLRERRSDLSASERVQ